MISYNKDMKKFLGSLSIVNSTLSDSKKCCHNKLPSHPKFKTDKKTVKFWSQNTSKTYSYIDIDSMDYHFWPINLIFNAIGCV